MQGRTTVHHALSKKVRFAPASAVSANHAILIPLKAMG
jgi:hypothetical protein